MTALRLFERPRGPHCAGCPLLPDCGGERSDNACAPSLDLAGVAGPHLLHPLRADFDEYINRVGGVGFDDVQLRPTHLFDLEPNLPQVEWLRRLRAEELSAADFPAVAVRLKEVFVHNRIRGANELREQINLSNDVAVVLLLHGKDELLERFAADPKFLWQIAAGGYALVTPPSFSLWEPQRRPDNLLSLRRSVTTCAELQEAGANACLRVGWVERRDVERLAALVTRDAINFVSLDLMTYQQTSFERAVALLALFDELTGRRIRYLIDGVRAQQRIEALYLAAAAERVTVTQATLPIPASALLLPPTDRSFRSRAQAIAARCTVARMAVEAVDEPAFESVFAPIKSLELSVPAQRR